MQNLETRQRSLDGGIVQVKRGDHILFALRLGVRLQDVAASQTGLCAQRTLLVGGQERVVPLFEILRFGQQLFEFSIDDLSDLRGKRLRKTVKGFAEAQELNMESRVACVNLVSGGKTFERKCVFFY